MQTKETANAAYESQLNDWIVQEKAAIELIGTIGKLWFEKSIELVLFRNQLIDRNVSDIINLHEYAVAFVKKPINIFDSVEIARAIEDLDLPPSRTDIGKLTYEYHLEDNKYNDAKAFVIDKLRNAKNFQEIKPKDVVLYGFGRIGRLLAREMMSKIGKGQQLRLRAIVTRDKNDAVLLEKRASLLRYDRLS